MADPTPIEAAAAALRDDETKRLGVEKTLTPERAIRTFWQHMARTALTAAIAAIDLPQFVVRAEYAWAGRQPFLGVNPADHPSIPQFVGAVLHAALLLEATEAPAVWRCSRCGSDRWVGWRAGPAQDGFPRRAQCVPCGNVQGLPDGTAAEAGEADPGLLAILLGSVLAVLAGAGLAALATGLLG
ncbi:hypothetical protein [Promicromonospora sp. NPDC023805]|uniref:hypothetical protein n=1 Tax=Promicromonospora sp. NPDC023805 TaxID=3154696 RepID=UPI00340338FC